MLSDSDRLNAIWDKESIGYVLGSIVADAPLRLIRTVVPGTLKANGGWAKWLKIDREDVVGPRVELRMKWWHPVRQYCLTNFSGVRWWVLHKFKRVLHYRE